METLILSIILLVILGVFGVVSFIVIKKQESLPENKNSSSNSKGNGKKNSKKENTNEQHNINIIKWYYDKRKPEIF